MLRTFAARTRTGALALAATGALLATVATFGGPATPAQAGVSADINLHIGNRPAPVVVFDREPDVVLVPRSRVYYVDHEGYDLYRYGRYWYINDDGYWFRASSYRGPFVSLAVGRVPRQIVVVPARYRRHPIHPVHPHGGPPGHMKRGGRDVVYDDGHRGDRRERYRDDDDVVREKRRRSDR